MSAGGQRFTPRDAPRIRWAWGAQPPTVLNLQWGQATVPAAALAYTESRVFLAFPSDGPSGRGRPNVAQHIAHETAYLIPLVDDAGEPTIAECPCASSSSTRLSGRCCVGAPLV